MTTESAEQYIYIGVDGETGTTDTLPAMPDIISGGHISPNHAIADRYATRLVERHERIEMLTQEAAIAQELGAIGTASVLKVARVMNQFLRRRAAKDFMRTSYSAGIPIVVSSEIPVDSYAMAADIAARYHDHYVAQTEAHTV